MTAAVVAPCARRLTSAWLLLAVSALGLATLLALLLVLARAPYFGTLLPSTAWFRSGLVLHVNLAVTVWFVSFAAALWSAHAAPRMLAPAWIGFALSASGVAALVLTPALMPAVPVLSNYVPVLDSPLFLAGLAWFVCGALLAGMFALLSGAPAQRIGCDRFALRASAIPLLAALGSLLWTALRLPADLPRATYFDQLFWSAGHVAQLGYVCLLMLAWLELMTVQGIALSRRALRACFLVQVAPVLAVPALHCLHAPASPAFRDGFTALMILGAWPGALLLAVLLLRAARGRTLTDAPAAAAFRVSVALFLLGLVLGMAIRADTAMVPAHYHGTVGAVTAALMAVALRLLPRLGFAAVSPRVAVLQARLYGSGLWVLAIGLAWSGWHGVPRKLPLAAHALGELAQLLGMGAMALGGVLAVSGAACFCALVGRSMAGALARTRTTHDAATGSRRRDRRAVALAATLGSIALGGAVVSVLPGNAVTTGVGTQARGAADEPAELRQQFELAVARLRAGQPEQAAIALRRVLVLAPQLPEAHANMGYALLGMQRFGAARTFFESATALRPAQANAYYGLAVALEQLDDLPGAVGAMRTYVHLTDGDDPHVRKARAALWEWEAQLTRERAVAQLGTGQSLPAEVHP
jgi:Flp pilus assembly protein TadD